MIKEIIAGGRDFNDYKKLEKKCLNRLEKYSQKEVTIVSGGAIGTDKLGEKFAKKFGLSIERHLADWDYYGKLAGYRRNKEMAEKADILIAFWDGDSRGTQDMIRQARGEGLVVHIIRYENES